MKKADQEPATAIEKLEASLSAHARPEAGRKSEAPADHQTQSAAQSAAQTQEIPTLSSLIPALMPVAAFSAAYNILALTGSFYMMQVYDRVLTGRNVSTLVTLSLIALMMFLFQGGFDVIRGRILTRMGLNLEQNWLSKMHRAILASALARRPEVESNIISRDVETVQRFVLGQGPLALVDLPWMPLFLIFVFMLHPVIGWFTISAMVVLVGLTLLTDVMTQKQQRESGTLAAERASILDSHRRHVEAISAMGFSEAARARYLEIAGKQADVLVEVNDRSGLLTGAAKAVRIIIQSAILGLGAYLAIKGEISGGSIIACTIIFGRAVAPLELLTGRWRDLVAARQSYARLMHVFKTIGAEPAPMSMPLPHESIEAKNLSIYAPPVAGSQPKPLLRHINFQLKQGQSLALIGPSGAGKTSLLRAVAGLWPMQTGEILLDNMPRSRWKSEDLGAHIGYLSQEINLFDVSIAANIARLDSNPDPAKVIEAAKNAGIHTMIASLPDGYETRVGENGARLSAGQKQRLGLARAFYGNPFLLILDEPNAHLDEAGEIALVQALNAMRAKGTIVIMAVHRTTIFNAVDHIGYLQDGELREHGPRDYMIQKIQAQAAKFRPQLVPNAEKGTK